MPPAPLTHHEILGLVEPFARSGRQVDLAASDRAQRRLVFKPVQRLADASAGLPPLHETLVLDSLGTGTFTLTRSLARADGLQATLQAMGAQPAELLARIDAVPAGRQFVAGPGHVIARSYGFESADDARRAGRAAPQAVLSRAELRLDGLVLGMGVQPVRGVAADISLQPAAGETLALPEDLLAVLGWDWARLVPGERGWTSKLRLRGGHARRSQTAERALDRVAGHLVQLLAGTPAQFHDRHRWARWGVVLRRAIPSLTALGLLVGALLLPRLPIDQKPGLWVALHYAPIGLLALAFCLQELPRFEIPPWPRRDRSPHWRLNCTPRLGVT